MASFGQLLRQHRRQCQDPQRGGPLTQERLGELLGESLGNAGYSGAAVSEWERDKSKIDEDNRFVLVGLIRTLHQAGGLVLVAEADRLLQAGNYRALNAAEQAQLFPDQPPKLTAGSMIEAASDPLNQPTSKERRKQLILLEKVRSFWVEGVLEKTTAGGDNIAPRARLANEFVARPWDGIVEAVGVAKPFVVHEPPLVLYERGDRSLLILGKPGAGKTMMLLSLASALIEQARQDASHPIPVVFNLVTWAQEKLPLEAWVVEELTAKYMIPRQTGRQWLADDDLVLLLDGFDDVPIRQRRRCAQAINAFRATHGLCGIVICSRSRAYETAGVKLKLGTAVELQPLEDGQIDRYLKSKGQRLETLRLAVERDNALHDMASNPLMLNIMSQAYDETAMQDASTSIEATFSRSDPLVTRRQRLFDTYVNRMVRRRIVETAYTPEQMTRWLAWLAGQMSHFQQSPFLLEQLQPSWLPNRRWRWLYLISVGLLSGLFTALIIWMLLRILTLPTPELESETVRRLGSVIGLSRRLQAEAIVLIGLNLILGLAFALLQGRFFEQVSTLPEEPQVRSPIVRQHLALVALVTGAGTFAVASLSDAPGVALAWATAEAFIFVIIARYVFGVSYNSEIRTVESLGWSWPSALRGLAIGLAAAIVFEIMAIVILGNDDSYLTMVIPAVGGLVLGGMRGRRVEATSRPNQGILLSFRNSFIAATLSAMVLAALTLYVRQEAFAGQYALRTAILIFIIAGALFGGSNVIKHYLVRLLLWLSKDLPWDVVRLLDEAADLVFLRKVGGGYIFIHRLLQHYFASLHRPHEEEQPGQHPMSVDRRYPESQQQ